MIYIYLSALETDEDRIQFEDIYRKYKNRMYKFAISILHNNEDAEDVIHQALLIIANNFEKIKLFSCHEMNAYIVIIIRNTSINLYNKIKGFPKGTLTSTKKKSPLKSISSITLTTNT